MANQEYTVQDGEDGPSIAARFGFPNFDAIWDLDENRELREKRPNANQLFPGDVVWIPEKQVELRSAREKSVNSFKVTVPKRKLCIVMRDDEGRPVAEFPYRVLSDRSVLQEGKTDASGLIDVDVPAAIRTVQVAFAGGTTRTVVLGGLNPMKDTPDGGASGVAQRLNALGYDAGPVDGSDQERLASAVRCYKSAQGLEGPDDATLDDALFDSLTSQYGQ